MPHRRGGLRGPARGDGDEVRSRQPETGAGPPQCLRSRKTLQTASGQSKARGWDGARDRGATSRRAPDSREVLPTAEAAFREAEEPRPARRSRGWTTIPRRRGRSRPTACASCWRAPPGTLVPACAAARFEPSRNVVQRRLEVVQGGLRISVHAALDDRQQVLEGGGDREPLRSDDDASDRIAARDVRVGSGRHGRGIVGEEDATLRRCPLQYSRLGNAGEPSILGPNQIDIGKSLSKRSDDVPVEILVRGETDQGPTLPRRASSRARRPSAGKRRSASPRSAPTCACRCAKYSSTNVR